MASGLGLWLEDERKKAELTKTAMAKKIGVSLGQYINYVSGKSKPRKSTLDKISEAFSVSVEELAQMPTSSAPAQPLQAIQESPAPSMEISQAQISAAQNQLLLSKMDLLITLLMDINSKLSK